MKRSVELLMYVCKYPHEEEYMEKLYEELVDKAWWSDAKIVNDIERERFLYKAFMDYYDLIISGEIEETEKYEDEIFMRRMTLINKCRHQLEKELRRVQDKDYIKE